MWMTYVEGGVVATGGDGTAAEEPGSVTVLVPAVIVLMSSIVV